MQNKTLSILYVEDDADTREAMRRLLTIDGHSVIVSGTVADAIEAAAKTRIDLLISDLQLPDGSGLQLLPQLRAIYPVQGIVLSGFGTHDDIASCLSVGFAEHLVKPIVFDVLREAIARVRERAAAQAKPHQSGTASAAL
jgi:DNA-binding NtrC family response regulator